MGIGPSAAARNEAKPKAILVPEVEAPGSPQSIVCRLVRVELAVNLQALRGVKQVVAWLLLTELQGCGTGPDQKHIGEGSSDGRPSIGRMHLYLRDIEWASICHTQSHL